ncbi:MAG: DUF4062 domain-containing protein [Acidobacteriia bacterium]|nr:DUF4062 domain-containing protein [Terriglobia bacterium]
MARAAIVLRILIASPSDVEKERELFTDVIHTWNGVHSQEQQVILEPIKWETHSYPASGGRPQQLLNKQIVSGADAVIGIFGCRIGTPTGEALSGTIEEIEELRRAGRHVALYFSDAPVPRDSDRGQLEALKEYRAQRQKDSLYSTYSTLEELRSVATRHLPQIIRAVIQNLRSRNELGRLETGLSKFEARAEQQLSKLTAGSRDEFRNPQIKAEFIGEYPNGPILWITADRDIVLTQLDYLDMHEAKIDSDRLERSGQDFQVPIDHAKLVKINNLMQAAGRPFRMKFRAEITFNGRAISHVIPVIVEPSTKLIEGAITFFLKIVGSTTGYVP